MNSIFSSSNKAGMLSQGFLLQITWDKDFIDS